MASLHHQIQYWTWNIPAGSALWLSFGPSDAYLTGTVQVMCSPSTRVAGTSLNRTQTISVPVVFNTVVPSFMGDIVLTSAYVGFNVTNSGQQAIQYFSVAISIIKP